ncbi:MAG: DNA helicase RecQ [Butyricicoccus pullicaecorum]|nr:DNA helicase RecQ [Butyricicoccus pullicaecorum]
MRTPEEILKEYFGHSAFRGRQKELVDALLEGRDVLGVMPTGAGKSVCYQVPALLVPGLTLVISPLISLMKDQVQALEQAGIPAACLNSTMPADAQRTVFARAYRGELRLLYAAPERLPGLQNLFERVPLAFVAVDEAHCISQWGQDFRPSYGKITDFLAAVPERPPVGAFTATATDAVRQDIVRLLGLRDPLVCVSGFDRPNLTFMTEKPRDKREHLVTLLRERMGQSGIVYCATRKAVDELAELLTARGFAAGRYHAGLDADERRENQDDFLFDRIQIMVATNAFGMGIDKSNVSFVIHYNLPQNLESYYQEAGRAGRDGSPADCILLYSPGDVRTCEFLIEHGHDNEELDERTRHLLIERDRERLRQMVFYATTTDCLRRFILKYFGEQAPLSCGNCSNCLTNFELVDATLEAQKIVSCVFRLAQRGRTVGKSAIADILHGADNARIRQNDFASLSTYGIMRADSMKHIRDLLDRLIEEGYLISTGGEYPVVKLCAKSDDIIRRRLPFAVKLPRDKRKQDGRKITESSLYEALRALRAEIAAQEKVPAYVVFSNATLQDMCARQPITEGELLEVSGVGRAKADKYGDAFLACIKKHVRKAAGQEPAPAGAAAAQRISAQDQGLLKPWTDAEDDWLRAETQEHLRLPEIAARHERPLGAVLARLKKLGLPILR